MYKILILIAIFLVVVYVFLFIRIKKTKEKTDDINSVRDFNSLYKHRYGQPKSPEHRNHTDADSQNTSYRAYVTKYNSSEDYREKR